MTAPAKLLIVDDNPQNVRVLEAVLSPHGYALCSANSGDEALRKVASERPDLVLLDIVMPGLDGHEVCRRLRADPSTTMLPVVMITASGDQERVRALESGADDFLQKPFNHAEILARIKSLLRIKDYHDTIQAQASQLAGLNRDLENRVRDQVAELERLSRLRRFLSPGLADILVSAEGEELLESHRRQIAVMCCQLRGFGDLAETSVPEEVMAVLREYHAALDEVVSVSEGSVGLLSGDDVMVFFNDPLPVDEPAVEAVGLALAVRDCLAGPLAAWRRRGFDLGFAAGVDLGYATLGTIGFESRPEYGAVGPVVQHAGRLRDAAQPGQILIGHRAHLAIELRVLTSSLGEVALPGAARPTPVFAVHGFRTDASMAQPKPAEEGGVLTPREREVVILIARGSTNRQIAETLVIAEPTAVRHVANILNKLNLSSRARVAVWAVEHGMLSSRVSGE